VPVSPDLAVEFESTSNREGELLSKVDLYLRSGTRAVWMVRPKHRTVTVFRPDELERVLREADIFVSGALLPGLVHPFAELFGVLDSDQVE